ncbi:MAG: DUF309 domain-containing protein [Nitrospiria bacterium]
MNLKLRNRLSEILLEGLKRQDQTETLTLLSAYCQAVRTCGSTRIRLKDLSLPGGPSLLTGSDCGILSINGVPGGGADPELDLLAEFYQEVDYLCERIAAYNGVFLEVCKISDSPVGLDRAVRTGVLLFNKGLYFECHEFLEVYWREEKGETKEFLQGIISLSTALYHLEQGNRPSVIKLLNDARHRLASFGRVHWGLAIEVLVEQAEEIQTLVEEGDPAALERLKKMPPPTIVSL